MNKSCFCGSVDDREDQMHERLVKTETIGQCKEFVKCCFRESSKIKEVQNAKNAVWTKAQEILGLESDNLENFQKFLEYQIQVRGVYHLLILHYMVAKGNSVDNYFRLRYDSSYFGVLGKVTDIDPQQCNSIKRSCSD